MFQKIPVKQIRRYTFAVTALLFIAISLVSLFPISASAEIVNDGGSSSTQPSTLFSKLTIQEKAQVWSEISAIHESTSNNGCNAALTKVGEKEAAAGEWLYGTKPFGYHVESDDGKLNCANENDWFSKLLDKAGFSGDYITPAKQIFTFAGYGVTSTPTKDIHDLLAKAFFGSASAMPKTAMPEVTYQILLSNFVAGRACNAKPFTNNNDVTSNNLSTASIYIYDDGDVKQVKYVYNNRDGKGVNIGYGLGINGDEDGTLQCESIAKTLAKSQYAAAARLYAISSGDSSIGDTASGPGNGIEVDNCPIPSGALRWILCPVFELGQDTLVKLDGLIANFLYTPTAQIFNDKFRDVTNNFRNLGLALLFIAGLVMVIGQAIGLEIFDAYTVRKIMPRLIIAAIGIALAWPILQFIVTFFNDLGAWTGALITQVIPSNIGGAQNGAAASATIGTLSVFLGLLGGLGAFIILGPMGLVSLVFTAVLALLIGLLVLAIRQMVILMAVLLAPLAIAAYILPGTQKLWAFWKNSFITALVMFPIIMAFIAAGKAMSFILAATGQSELQLLSLIIYFAPYFLLPFAFKMAGGLMSTVFSIANDKSRGLFDRGKKYRQGQTAYNMGRLKAGDRFNNGKLNAFTARATTKNLGYGRRGREAYEQKTRLTSLEHAKSAQAQAVQFNDNALRAQTYESEAQARENLRADFDPNLSNEDIETAIAGARANGGFGIARQRFAAQQLAATGTGYKNMRSMNRTIARVAKGNTSVADAMLGDMRSATERASRSDMKAGFATQRALVHAEMAGGNATPGKAAYMAAVVEAAREADNATLARSKGAAIDNIGEAMAYAIQNPEEVAAAHPTIAPQDVAAKAGALPGEILAKIENLKGSSIYGSEANAARLQDTIRDRSVAESINATRQEVIPTIIVDGQEQPNPNYNPESGTPYNEQRQQRIYDPNDPRYNPQRPGEDEG